MGSPVPPDIPAREAATRAGATLAATPLLLVFFTAPAGAQDTQDDSPTSQNAAPSQVTTATVTCSSKPFERSSCAADTSKGVVLLRSTGEAPCLLGRTWGYDTKVKYMAMFANNLSTLGVSAAHLDNRMDTQSYSVQWLPPPGEFGLFNGFGDHDAHEKVATRIGVHYSHSLEEKQSQPGTEGIENSQIRLTDGSSIFTPDLFGPGITATTSGSSTKDVAGCEPGKQRM
jgi:hypothetical protein